MAQTFVPGDIVRHPDRPDWGTGQVQSSIGNQVTVNFEHVGKQTLRLPIAKLEIVDPGGG